MRTSTAYFAGAGTVVAAIAAGVGGGLLMAKIVSPHSSKHGTEMTRLERRMSEPISVMNAPSEPVPYIAATQAATDPAVAAPAQDQPQQTPPQKETANTTQAAAPPAEPAAARDTSTAPSPAPEKAASPEDSFAKARDADMKRASAEKRRAERREQWAERRRYYQRRDQELRDVEQKVREDTGPPQAFAAEPAKVEMPRIHFLDAE